VVQDKFEEVEMEIENPKVYLEKGWVGQANLKIKHPLSQCSTHGEKAGPWSINTDYE